MDGALLRTVCVLVAHLPSHAAEKCFRLEARRGHDGKGICLELWLLAFHPAIFASLTDAIMRFQLGISLLMAFATAVIAQALLDESSSDLSLFQNIPEDSLWSDSDSIADYDLFDDSSVSNLALVPDSDFSQLEASCLPAEGQPLGKVRARDGEICAPNPAPKPASNVEPLPLKGGLRELGENLKKLWDGATIMELMKEDPPPPAPLPWEYDGKSNCPLEYPYHLCCDVRGDFGEFERGRAMPYRFFECDTGTSDSWVFYLFDRFNWFDLAVDNFPCLKVYDVCCRSTTQEPRWSGLVWNGFTGRNCWELASKLPDPSWKWPRTWETTWLGETIWVIVFVSSSFGVSGFDFQISLISDLGK